MRWLCVVLMACGGTTESFVDEAGETQEVTPPVETVADADTQSKPPSLPQGAVDLHPAVFALTLKGGACQWTLVSVSSGKSATVNTTPTCPSEIVFNQKQNAVVYRTEKGLYQSDWPVAGPPSPIGGLSSVGGSLETIHGLGFHKGALRIGLLVEAPSTVEGDVRTYRFAGKTLQSRITDDGDYFKRVGGQTVPANEGDAEAVWMDPNWGIAGVGVIAERSSAGAWSVVEAAPTQWGRTSPGGWTCCPNPCIRMRSCPCWNGPARGLSSPRARRRMRRIEARLAKSWGARSGVRR